MKGIKLLLVEDEKILAMVLKETFEGLGFMVAIAANGIEAWSLYAQFKPDICVMDIMLPKSDGITLVQQIRLVDIQTPIIFLTAKSQTEDVIAGLKAGADDYIKKPFSMEELALRINILVRRIHQPDKDDQPQHDTISFASYRLDYVRLQLNHPNTTFYLSQREADLLYLLLQRKNQLLERNSTLMKIWGDDSVFNARTMDVYITKLRKYLQYDSTIEIVNVRGKGYKLIV